MVELLGRLDDRELGRRHPRSRPEPWQQPAPDPWPYRWPPPPDDAEAVPMVAREPLAVPGSDIGLIGYGTVMPGEVFLAPPASAVLRMAIRQADLAGPAPAWWPPAEVVPLLRTPAEFLDATGGRPAPPSRSA